MRTRSQKIFFCICNTNSKKKKVKFYLNFFVKNYLIFISYFCMFDTTVSLRIAAVFVIFFALCYSSLEIYGFIDEISMHLLFGPACFKLKINRGSALFHRWV